MYTSFVCTQNWEIYGGVVEKKRRGVCVCVCVCVCVWKRKADHFRAVRLLPLAGENKRQCLGAGGSAHGRRCNLGRFLASRASARISAAMAHSHKHTHSRTHSRMTVCPKTHKLLLHSRRNNPQRQ